MCAYPGCRQGKAIAEGAPARFALADPTKWCHKACADAWERQSADAGPAKPAPDPDPILCGAPHPELNDFICSKPAHPGDNYHNDGGAGHSWYMEPGQVVHLQEAIAKRTGALSTVIENKRTEIETALGVPMDEAMTAAPILEVPTQDVHPEHQCCEHCGPGGHAPHTNGCPIPHGTADLTTAPTAEQFHDSLPPEGTPVSFEPVNEADLRPPAEEYDISDVRNELIDEPKIVSKGTVSLGDFDIGESTSEALPFLVDIGVSRVSAQRANQAEFDNTARILELVSIFQNNGFSSAPAGLVTDLIDWKRNG